MTVALVRKTLKSAFAVHVTVTVAPDPHAGQAREHRGDVTLDGRALASGGQAGGHRTDVDGRAAEAHPAAHRRDLHHDRRAGSSYPGGHRQDHDADGRPLAGRPPRPSRRPSTLTVAMLRASVFRIALAVTTTLVPALSRQVRHTLAATITFTSSRSRSGSARSSAHRSPASSRWPRTGSRASSTRRRSPPRRRSSWA